MVTIDLCCKFMNNTKIPSLSGKEIYASLRTVITPEVETNLPLYNWKNIWSNIHSKYVDKYDRVVVYKFIYNVLPTKKKLKAMNIHGIDTELCSMCNEPESNIHLSYFCKKIKCLLKFSLKLCEDICNKNIGDPLAFLYFDFRMSNMTKHVCALIISCYIGTVWSLRNENIGLAMLKRKLLSKIRYNIQSIILCYKLNDKNRKLFIDLDQRCINLIY